MLSIKLTSSLTQEKMHIITHTYKHFNYEDMFQYSVFPEPKNSIFIMLISPGVFTISTTTETHRGFAEKWSQLDEHESPLSRSKSDIIIFREEIIKL